MDHIANVLICFCTLQTGYLLMVALSLMARTYCDVWMIQNGTSIEAAIIARNKTLFVKHLMAYVYAMPLVCQIILLIIHLRNELQEGDFK